MLEALQAIEGRDKWKNTCDVSDKENDTFFKISRNTIQINFYDTSITEDQTFREDFKVINKILKDEMIVEGKDIFYI